MKQTIFQFAGFALAAGFLAAHPSFCQTSGGKPIQFLWTQRKSPFPIPKPAWLPDTTYVATDTLKNSWLVAYQAASPNGAAMVVMPGGGYLNLAGWANEGVGMSLKMNTYGITTFILHYRVGVSGGTGPYQHPCEMWDGQRAVRWVRAHAAQYGVDPNRVGVMGFSAGGHLATTVATHYDGGNPAASSIDYYPAMGDSVDAFSCQPAFQVLGYPMVTMDATFAYGPGRTALLGSTPSAALVDLMSNEKQVTPSTSPVFLFYGTSDNTVNPKNSTAYSDSLQAKGVTHKVMPFNTSVHGFALADGVYGTSIPAAAVWPDSLNAWLRRMGFLTPTVIFPARHGAASTASFLKTKTNGWLDVLGRLFRERRK